MQLRERIVMTGVLLMACDKSAEADAVDAGMMDAQGMMDEPDAMPMLDATQMPDAMEAPDGGPILSVSDGVYLDELTSEQANTLCTWMVDIQGGPHTIDCDEGTQVTIDPVASCLENEWPHCEVGLLRTCVEAQAIDECALAPAACTAFYQCAGA